MRSPASAARAVVERTVDGPDGVNRVTRRRAQARGRRSRGDGRYNHRLLHDHRIATRPDAPREVVRAAMVRLANGFAKGTPGVGPELLGGVVDALDAGETPVCALLGFARPERSRPAADLAYGICGDMTLAARKACR